MNVTKKIRKKFNFLTVRYGLLCGKNSYGATCFYNDKISIIFDYDFIKHEYLDLSITKCDKVIMKVSYEKVFWSDNAISDEQFCKRLEDVFALRHQFIMLCGREYEIIDIYADYLEKNMNKILEI